MAAALNETMQVIDANLTALKSGMSEFLDKNASRGWNRLDDFRGLRRDRIVAHHEIKRPDAKEYHGGHEAPEGYSAPAAVGP